MLHLYYILMRPRVLTFSPKCSRHRALEECQVAFMVLCFIYIPPCHKDGPEHVPVSVHSISGNNVKHSQLFLLFNGPIIPPRERHQAAKS